jgi:hypothetical protein
MDDNEVDKTKEIQMSLILAVYNKDRGYVSSCYASY